MAESVLTSKGQTTIPKEIREYLHLKPLDKILYVPDGERVVISPVRGTILELRGVIRTQKRPLNFKGLREKTKRAMAKKAMGEMR